MGQEGAWEREALWQGPEPVWYHWRDNDMVIYQICLALSELPVLPVSCTLGTVAAVHIKNKSPRYLQLPSGHTPHFFQQKRKLVFY